jgi:hypothetical protein
MRYKFTDIFTINAGIVGPKVPVHINGVTMNPGVSFGDGVSFGGVNLQQYLGKDVEADLTNGVYVIKGFY